jgi:hypothetical protein
MRGGAVAAEGLRAEGLRYDLGQALSAEPASSIPLSPPPVGSRSAVVLLSMSAQCSARRYKPTLYLLAES